MKKNRTMSKHNRTSNDLNGYYGICIGFNRNYNVVYSYVMDPAVKSYWNNVQKNKLHIELL